MLLYKSQEELQENMLNNIRNTVDKTENSMVHDALYPASIELANFYVMLEYIAGKLDVENLEGFELERFIYQRTAIERIQATYANDIVIISGTEGSRIKKGELVSTDTVNFRSLEDKKIGKDGQMVVRVEAEVKGSSGNVPINSINQFPVMISGLVDVYNPNAIRNGYDEETDKDLRKRYYEKLQKPAKSGNKYHYEQWAKEVPGVGSVKVISRWRDEETIYDVRALLENIIMQGGYTESDVTNLMNAANKYGLAVKVIIVDANGQPANENLISNVTKHIEEERPFGADVTVISAIGKKIDISLELVLADGYEDIGVKEGIKANIADYLESVAFKVPYISYAKIGSIALATEGVLDYKDLLVNSGTSNIDIDGEEVAIIGGVN